MKVGNYSIIRYFRGKSLEFKVGMTKIKCEKNKFYVASFQCQNREILPYCS